VQNFGRRAVATARHITQRSKQVMSTVGLPLSKLPGMVQPVRALVASSVTNPVSVSALLHMQYYNFELLLNYSTTTTTTLHPFVGLFSRINLRKSQYQKSKTR